MHLISAPFDPQLIKGEILQYCKGLIASIKNNHVLTEQYFHTALLGDEDFMHHTFHTGDFIYWKRHLQKESIQPRWKGP